MSKPFQLGTSRLDSALGAAGFFGQCVVAGKGRSGLVVDVPHNHVRDATGQRLQSKVVVDLIKPTSTPYAETELLLRLRICRRHALSILSCRSIFTVFEHGVPFYAEAPAGGLLLF